MGSPQDRDDFLSRVIEAYGNPKHDHYRLFSEEFLPAVRAQVDLIESLLGSKPPARVLDLACGSGSATIETRTRARWSYHSGP